MAIRTVFDTEENFSKYLSPVMTQLFSVNITDSGKMFILRGRSLYILYKKKDLALTVGELNILFFPSKKGKSQSLRCH